MAQVSITITDKPLFSKYLALFEEFTKDERISEEIRIEFYNKLKELKA